MPPVTPSALLLAAVSEGGGPSFTNVNFTLAVASFVLFLIFTFVLTKFGWKPLLRMIEKRESSVREAVEGAERANAEAQALLEKHREILRQAAREREEMLNRAVREAEQIKADLVARARTEGDQLMQRAKDQIEREKGRAIQELRVQVADLAIEAASKIVRSSLTPEVQRKLVAEFIETLPKAQ